MADVQPLSIAAIRAELKAYEDQYGLPSDRMTEAFDRGEPTDDQMRWVTLYAALAAVLTTSPPGQTSPDGLS